MVTLPNIIVDTREKRPWEWETDDAFGEVIHKKLDAGDYSIEGMENVIAIERKAGVDELYNNFTKDKKRIYAEFERMRDYRFKIIIIEQSCEDIMNPRKYYVNKKKINRFSPKMPVAVVTSELNKIMLEYGVQVIFGGDRAQAMAKGILLQAYDMWRKGKLDER